MAYKIGDKVKIREDLSEGVYYDTEDGTWSDDCASEMLGMKGKIVTIKEITRKGYYLEEIEYNWTDEMFDGKVYDNNYEFKWVRDETLGVDQLMFGVTEEGVNKETVTINEIEDEIVGMLDYARELTDRHKPSTHQIIDYIQGTIRDIFAKNKK